MIGVVRSMKNISVLPADTYAVVNKTVITDKDKKILHIELELESLVTGHKIKIATAVFMPSCESLVVNDE